MLLNTKDIHSLLRCPIHKTPLLPKGEKLLASDVDPVKANHGYEIVKGYPILVDFNHSILTQEDTAHVASVIERNDYKGVAGIIKQILLPSSAVTENNVQYLVNTLHEKESLNVLIVGGGTPGQSMEVFYDDPQIALVSFDIYASDTVQFVADAHNIPLPTGQFDVVIIQAVLEHVLDPLKVVAELHRVLKDDGVVYAETPFLQHVHEGAYDFTRYTESGHRYLFKDFSLIKSGTTAGAGTQLLWSLEYFVRGLFRSRLIGKAAKLGFFWLQYLDRLIPESYNIDAASGVFFMGKKQAATMARSEAVAHYRGAQ